jgi:hypothetical protein
MYWNVDDIRKAPTSSWRRWPRKLGVKDVSDKDGTS